MIGIDVIDWDHARKSRWDEQRFREKFCTGRELIHLANAENVFFETWKIWAAKEAAFKAWSMLSHETTFRPRHWEYDGNSHIRKVNESDYAMPVEWIHLENGLVSWVQAGAPFGKCEGGALRINDSGRKEPQVYVFGECLNTLTMEDEKLPRYGKITDLQNTNHWISRSHHGRYDVWMIAREA